MHKQMYTELQIHRRVTKALETSHRNCACVYYERQSTTSPAKTGGVDR